MAWQRTVRTAAENGTASRAARVRRGAALLLTATAISLSTALIPAGDRSAAREAAASPESDSPMARALAAYEAIQAAKALPADWSPASVVPAAGASAAVAQAAVAPAAAPAAGFAWPAGGTLTQGYGCTEFALEPWSAALGCYFHEGLDIANVEGTVVVATAAGQVTWAGWTDDGYGYSVQLDHGNGLTSRYGHLCCAPMVVIGQRVATGEPIGLMGTTGASTGPHPHFTIHLNGQPVDPRDYLG